MKQRLLRIPGSTLIISAFLFFSCSQAGAQVTGTKTIGVDYPTLAAAVTDLNTNGISGAVTINIPSGYTETAPAGGYLLGSTVLNSTATATNTLTFQKSGPGADPLLTAPVGTSTTLDGIFTIAGTDYVTINGIDLTESPLNTTAITWMEWGFGLIKRQSTAPFDGCQNVTIENCTVTLNILNTPSVGIYANNHISTSTTALAITATTDAMNNCRFYSNIIQNCNTGISLRGFATAASPYTLYDQNNDIGGSSIATSNTIQNFAGTTAGSGINLRYQNNTNVAFNTINNNAGGGVVATNIVYGVYAQNGTNPSVNINNNTINLTQGSTASSLYGVNVAFSGTGVINVNSNKLTANGGSTGSMYMIYLSSANDNVNTNYNNFYNINIATTGSLYFVYHNTASTTANINCNNNFTSGPSTPYVNKTGAGGTIGGYYNNAGSSGGFAILNSNNFSYINLAGSPTFYGLNETNGGSGQNKFMQNNVISNITSAGGTLYGLRVGYASTVSFTNNTISFLNAGTGSVYGINLVSGTTDTIANNSIHDFTSTNGSVYGINISGSTTLSIFQDTIYTLTTSGTTGLGYGIWEGGATTANIYQNKIYDISGTGTGSSINGMYLNSGANTIYNNIIGDLRTPNYNGAGGTQLVGMYLGGGSSYLAYYNSVFINGTSTGTDFGSAAVFASSTPPVTLRNNIFVNTSTPNGAGLTVAYRRGSTTLTTYQPPSNNNLFYAGTPGPSKVIYYDGTTAYQTLIAYKALVAPRDASSVTENPPFVSTTGSSPNFLFISTTVPTQVESGAINIPGITTDIVGTIRAGNPGYTGTGSTPDIGAVEGNYILSDLSAPNITYTALANACTTGDRTITSNITDASGVPTTGALVPRIYYMKGAGPWVSSAGTLTSGTATNGTWSFTISAAAMGGLSIGDIVSYFIIAQDVVATPNVGSNPGLGLVATDVNTISAYPTTPNTYTVIPTLTGTYNVGAGMAYATLTAAVTAYNTSCVTGPVTFLLTDPLYSTAETFPLTITANASASSVNTLTIKPAPGVAAVITGNTSSTAIFKLLNAQYITIDGVNTGSSSLTINNINTGNSAGIWLASTSGTGPGNSNITLNNMMISGGSNTTTSDWGILSGVDGATPSTGAGKDNDNITIHGNTFLKCGYGIYANGTAAVSAGGLDNWVISNNIVGPTTSGSTTIGYNGVYLGNALNTTITGNSLQYIGYNSSQPVGINLASNVNGFTISQNNINNVSASASASGTSANAGMSFGSNVINGTVTRNYITSISNTSTGGWGVRGIIVNTGNASSNITFSDNMISDIWCYADANFIYDPVGIDIDGTSGGINLYFNSINLFGGHTGYSSGNTFAADVYMNTSSGNINIRDNVFVNSYDNTTSSSDKSYTVYSAYPASAYSGMDYNDYSVAAPAGVLAYLGSDLTTLAAIQTGFGGNTHSINTPPVFVSSTDLHLQVAGGNAPLVSGVPIAGITVDIDGTTRSATTPVMGAHEVNLPICASVTAGSATPATPAFCNSGSTTISLAGSTAGLGIIYQWESSTDSLSWTNIAGASSNTYTTPVLTATTYYRVVLVCTFSGATDSASTRVKINPLPIIAVTPNGGNVCTGASGLSMTASGAATYAWSPAAGLSATTGATVVATPTVATTYNIVGVDSNGCQNSHSSTVLVIITPTAVTVTPNAATICSGGSQLLSAASTITGPGTALAMNFNSGIGAWTIDNTGSATTYPDVNWTIHGDGFTNELSTYHSPDNSNFILTNSDTSGSGVVVHTILISPTFSLVGYTAAALTFQQAYQSYFADVTVDVEISTDGGATWSVLHNYLGTSVGSYISFVNASVDLSTYLGMSNLMIRYNYQSTYGYYWALDNIAVSGTIIQPVTNMTWAPNPGLYTDAALTSPYTGSSTSLVYAAPTTTGIPAIYTFTATATNTTCSNTGTSQITVNPLPNAGTITGPDNVCPGAFITLSDNVSGGVWSSSNSSANVSPAGVVTGVSAGADTISYAVTNSCGTAVTTFTITTNPLADAGVITGPASVCAGGAPISLTESVSGGIWSTSNTNATISSTGNVTGISAGTDIISYTVTNICNTATATTMITINAAPYAGNISGPANVCAGSSITLSDTVTGGIWSSSNTTVATISATGVVMGVSGGTIIISYASTNGCGTAYAVIPITVNPIPTAYSVTGGGVYCAGATGVHVGLSGSDAGVNYQLYNASTPVGPLQTGTGSMLDFGLETAAGTYTVSAMSAAGCTGNMGGSVSIFVNPTTPPTVTISATNGDTVCTGTLTTFNAIIANGGIAPSYQWTVNGTTASTTNSYTYVPSNGDVVTVLVTSSSCASPDTASSTLTLNVVGFAMPTVSITSNYGNTACSGYPVTFTAATTYAGSSPLLRWIVNGINIATGSMFTYTPSNGDVIRAALFSSFPCRLSDSVFSNNIIMNIVSPLFPSVAITAHPGTLITAGQSDTLFAQAINSGPSPEYQWSINGTPIPGATNATFIRSTFMNHDSVSVVITTTGPCGGLRAYGWVYITIGTTGVTTVAGAIGNINLMPNPNKGTFTVKGTLATTEDAAVTIQITDMLGQVIYKNTVTAEKGQLNEQIMLSNSLANGMYMLNLHTDTEHEVFHFVIEQ